MTLQSLPVLANQLTKAVASKHLVLPPFLVQHRQLQSTAIVMSSDSQYADFLNKYSGAPTESSTNVVDIADQSRYFKAIPARLLKTPSKSDELSALSTEQNELFYSSETDLPFLPVLIDFAGKELPNGSVFADTLEVDPEIVEKLSVEEWDPQGSYKEVVERVKKGTKGSAAVYKVLGDGTRVGYFVLGISNTTTGLEGVRVGAVES